MKLELILIQICLLERSFAASILSTAREAGSFGTLVAALEKAGLTDTLDTSGDFTVFAPTDSAFATLLAQLDVEKEILLNRPDLGDILTFHVVPGIFASGDLRSGMNLQSLQGGQLTLAMDSNSVMVRDATVTTADLSCSNGVIHIIDKVLLPSERLVLAGGSKNWDPNVWSVTVDGVMGGKSTGSVAFEAGTMVFAGNINLNGGGFSSVRAAVAVDLTDYAGFWLEVGTTSADQAPLVLAFQIEDSTRRDFTAPIALPLASSPSTCRAFIPMSSFTRTTWSGESTSNSKLDLGSIRKLSFYVLYQTGQFEARIKNIFAVKSALDAPAKPTMPVVQGLDMDAAVNVLQNTINSGGFVYDKGYPSLCAEMYASSARTLVSSATVPAAARGVACAALSLQLGSAPIIAWAFRRAFDAIIADASGQPRMAESRYPSEVQGQWLPNAGAPSVAAAASCPYLSSGSSVSDVDSDADTDVSMESATDDSLLSGSFYGPFVGMGITDNNDFGKVKVSSPLECAKLCVANSECRSFDYGARSNVMGECWLSKADRVAAGNKYEAWAWYDYYEHKSRSDSVQSNEGLPSSSTQATAEEADADLPTWVFISLGGAVLMVIVLVGVVATLLLKRSKARHFEVNHNAQIVVGKPVGCTVAPVGGAASGVVLPA
jgi:uncharacterized surface protein with fasciclin (FAS1) repeats